LLPELLADLNTGHNIVATVFEECRSMYRANGPIEMRPVGEVEFVAGIAAMSASGGYPASRLTAIFASIGSFPSIDSVFDAHRTGPRGKSYQRRARLARTQSVLWSNHILSVKSSRLWPTRILSAYKRKRGPRSAYPGQGGR
jgi:hypothetical protein